MKKSARFPFNLMPQQKSTVSIPNARRMNQGFIGPAATVCNLTGLLALFLQVVAILPAETFKDVPPTGGDMGSHYWPLLTLLKYGINTFTWPVWNPGNLLGEAQLLHYFPLPFFVMLILCALMPPAIAFKLAVVLPIVLLSPCTYFAVKRLGYKFPCPLFCAVAVHYVLFNEAYSMWGGNILSTLAGQFAHLYAIVFLILGLGTLSKDVYRRRLPWSSIWFSCVALSHAYVLLGVPLCVLAFILFGRMGNLKLRFRKSLEAGFFSLCFSSWFLVPLLLNQAWTTSFSFKWIFRNSWEELFPEIFMPLAIGFLLAICLALFSIQRYRNNYRRVLLDLCFFLFPAICFFGFYFLFPSLGLVDIRAIPQALFFLALLVGVLLGISLSKLNSVLAIFSAIPLVLFSVWWINSFSVNGEYWFKWNFSGLESKPLYSELKNISEDLRGTFSDTRVIYSHSLANNRAGTPRVFEMLPYLANRATLESLYMESNIVSPMVYYIQALISKTPSCPHHQSPCPSVNIKRALEKLSLFGVSELILTDEEVIAMAREEPILTARGSYSHWNVFSLEGVELVSLPAKVLNIDGNNWRSEFFEWFVLDDVNKAYLAVASPDEVLPVVENVNCRPDIKANFNELVLTTMCPGKFHLLKFSYHPNWESKNKDKLYLTSPGFIGIVPNHSVTTLQFKNPLSWKIAAAVSFFSVLTFLMLVVRERRSRSDE